MDVQHIKQLLYYQRSSFSGLELHVCYNWQVMAPNMHCILFSMHSVCTYTKNLKTTGCTWPLYITNDCFAIGDICFVV